MKKKKSSKASKKRAPTHAQRQGAVVRLWKSNLEVAAAIADLRRGPFEGP